MANPTMAQILEDTRRLVGTKLAAAKTQKAAEIVGQDPASMPGAEHDSKTPEEAKKPDAETRDGTMVPTSGLTTEGAGDDSKITHGGDLGSEESALEPTKKPAVTSDANAKTASADLANEILSLVRGVQKQAAAAPAAPAKKEEPAATKAAAPAPAPAPAAAPAKKEEPEASDKSAGAPVLNMPLTTDIMAKLAALMLNTDEGAALAEKELEKQAGAEAAMETMQFLIQQSELAEKQAAYEQGLRDADAAIDQQIFMAGVHAAQAQMAKAGQALPPELAGAGGGEGADVAAMMAGGEGGAPEMGGGEVDPAMAGGEGGEGGEEFTMEDLQAALEALVAEGTLQPEEAQQLIASLTGEGGGEAAPAEGGGEAAPAEGGDAGGDAGGEAAPAEEGEKEASATNLLAAIRQLRAARAK